MAKPKESAPVPSSGSLKRLVSHDDKPDFWKPTKPGDVLYGKLLGVRIGGKGPVVSIKDFSDKVRAFGVPTQLRNVDWEDLVGKDVKLTYVKSVASGKGNPAKLFDLDAAE